jgi:hypothetical protein
MPPLEPDTVPHDGQRATDAELAALFPWMFIGAEPPAADATAAAADAIDAVASSAASSAAAAGAAAASDDGDDGCCAICMDAARDTALEPCGHALLCASCASAVLHTAAPFCPVCRVPATGCRAA